MKIRNKLRLGFAFLFVVVLVFGATAMYYIQEIASNATAILKNNYETLNYTKNMRAILDEHSLPLSTDQAKAFGIELNKQQHNVTEKGEGEATAQLTDAFTALTSTSMSDAEKFGLERKIRQQLRAIETLNMQAIIKKDDHSRKSVRSATILLSFVAGFMFLILFSFIINFPDIVASPLRTLLEGIREISQKNYSQRINFNRTDEFGELASAFNNMAAKLNDWENSNLATILSEKRRIETIVEQMQDAIIGINEKHELLFINDTARKLLNLPNDIAAGSNVEDLAKNSDLLKRVLSRQSEIKPLKIVVNGKENFFQLESREITVPNLDTKPTETVRVAGRSAGVVYVLRNVTEFKELDVAKTNFIATISHELKTPISSVKMSLKLLQDKRIGEINAEQQQLIDHIAEDNARLLKITSELLDLSQVETGNIQLNFTNVEPAKIVDYALKSIAFQAEQKNVKINFTKVDQLPLIQADVEKSAWVMVNFLSNALRYSAAGSAIDIHLKENAGAIEFTVTDHGKGIDEQYQKQLFDRYFQVPADGQNKTGTGLGLAISRDFIEAQNGRIWVSSAIGEGSTFGFSLPENS
ncbi:HAMP domain-containing sensor histidine kinase [Mucilaginibacter ginkgonis]|uniref:histidine kinase n=1 Tax=Mucilaginibacter ginkgonis TaxID=2682091 RepID=A0A6I4I1G7_9SPHI|nr:ATP-binding protein [Mucilaginibacter ginkgonis]QQL48977.1 HAMP domain-containing protein [Mucilaginibacter ginkgonis]